MAHIHKTILRRKNVEYVLNKNTASSRYMQVIAYEKNGDMRTVAEIDTKKKAIIWNEDGLDEFIKSEIALYN